MNSNVALSAFKVEFVSLSNSKGMYLVNSIFIVQINNITLYT
jgi:hypothetical protein